MKNIKVVCGVIFNSKNKLLITQRGDRDNFKKWEFPGGKMMGNESVFDSIRREIQEELSIKIEGNKILFESEIEIKSKIYNLIFIKCNYISGDVELKEHLDFKWIYSEQLSDFDFLEGDKEFIRFFKQN